MRVNNLCGSGQFSGFYMNDASDRRKSPSRPAPSRPRCRTAACASTARRKTAATRFSGTFFAYGAGSGAAGRQPLRRGEGRPSRSRSQASPTPSRSTRRSAGRSSGTSSGSTSPTSTRTTRSTSPAPRSPTAAAPSASRWATTAPSAALTWQASQQRQDPLLSREAVQRRVLQRLQHAADDHARSVDRCLRPRLGAAGQVDADARRTGCCSRPASRYYNQPYEQNYRRDGRAARPAAARTDDQPA